MLKVHGATHLHVNSGPEAVNLERSPVNTLSDNGLRHKCSGLFLSFVKRTGSLPADGAYGSPLVSLLEHLRGKGPVNGRRPVSGHTIPR